MNFIIDFTKKWRSGNIIYKYNFNKDIVNNKDDAVEVKIVIAEVNRVI
jgi:hypothetical protein